MFVDIKVLCFLIFWHIYILITLINHVDWKRLGWVSVLAVRINWWLLDNCRRLLDQSSLPGFSWLRNHWLLLFLIKQRARAKSPLPIIVIGVVQLNHPENFLLLDSQSQIILTLLISPNELFHFWDKISFTLQDVVKVKLELIKNWNNASWNYNYPLVSKYGTSLITLYIPYQKTAVKVDKNVN